MKQLHIRLSLIQLFLLVLNLFIFSSALPFLPWFVENALGWLGILATTPFLLIIGRIMPQLKQSEEIYVTRTRAVVPFIASIVSLCIMLLPTMKLSIVIVLIMNGLMALITIVYLLQDFWKMNEKYR
ncbi:hypothetical protein CON65_12510 [Bacillus pseudomycoides]|uniref:Uncharacterized protein n=1 Tax=Bacillus pseudomycoides TaxID=64104 RepID=A0AA91VC20_9BACI|nr:MULTISPECIES: hypothetical protein [Bacillus]PEB47806.1 hypothetical protein COO03_25015 [Bacillus sp. AFS098217]PED82342.1 hypothetical protein CON65_12510 [Bacillus pseudomycoides]PEU12729.1 hypothetical protein CN525_20560 [Bacillus sp. AFS014408]PEU13688.1 hypothetical protein CN524_11305 [Bacillus sp. AFS019443]PFW60121.1 hypothetical protein COL20_22945 [Bacillus sp. AFS075034]